MTATDTDKLLDEIKRIAGEAGSVILHVYDSDDFNVEVKDDNSPLTRADLAANEVITKGLQQISNLPIVSEENSQRDVTEGRFWLVDPLDGTKEFIKRNGEFTVNIALVDEGRPVLGVVYAPVLDIYYVGDVKTHVAYKQTKNETQTIKAVHGMQPPVVVVSRSHRDEKTERLLEAIGEYDMQSMGSSLKLCLVAEGAALLYPRLAPTSLWDTAAADAVVSAAGGAVKQLNGQRLVYEPAREILNPFFVVEAENNSIDWKELLSA